MRFEWEPGSEIPSIHGTSPESPLEDQAMQGEMDEFWGYASEQQDETIRIAEGEFNEQGRYIPGRIEGIDAEAAEFDPELRELSEALETWFPQSESMSCVVSVETMVLNQLENGDRTEREMLETSREKGWYNEGTCPEDVGKIAEYYGMDVEQHHGVAASELTLANNPEVKVMANVDSTLLQYPDAYKRCQPDHCVQVLRVERTAEGEMVILNDPGHAEGRGAVYPMEIFEKAYKGDITTVREAETA